MGCGNIAYENSRKITRYGSQFEETFKVGLAPFMDVIHGFDVATFRKYMQIPDDVAPKSYVAMKYGDQAAELLEEIILS